MEMWASKGYRAQNLGEEKCPHRQMNTSNCLHQFLSSVVWTLNAEHRSSTRAICGSSGASTSLRILHWVPRCGLLRSQKHMAGEYRAERGPKA